VQIVFIIKKPREIGTTGRGEKRNAAEVTSKFSSQGNV